MSIHRLIRGFLIVALCLQAGCRRTTTPIWTDSTTHATSIPFEFYDNHIFLPTRVNDSGSLWFILDSGDKYAVIDTDRAAAVGLKTILSIPVGGAGESTIKGKFVLRGKYRLEGVDGFSQPLSLAIPLARIAELTGHQCDGIIGTDFFNEFVVELDYSNHIVTLHDKKKFTYSGNGAVLPISFNDQGLPLIDGQLIVYGTPLKQGKFLLDLGAAHALVVNTPFVNEHALLNKIDKAVPIGSSGIGGFSNGRVGRIDGFRIGRWTIETPIAELSQDTRGTHSVASMEGSVGTEIMRRFRVFVDYPHKHVILEETPSLHDPFLHDESGMVLESLGPDYRRYRIARVLDGSPAHSAGLNASDMLISIDGKAVSAYRLADLHRMFREEREFDLEVQGGAGTRHVRLKTERQI